MVRADTDCTILGEMRLCTLGTYAIPTSSIPHGHFIMVFCSNRQWNIATTEPLTNPECGSSLEPILLVPSYLSEDIG